MLYVSLPWELRAFAELRFGRFIETLNSCALDGHAVDTFQLLLRLYAQQELDQRLDVRDGHVVLQKYFRRTSMLMHAGNAGTRQRDKYIQVRSTGTSEINVKQAASRTRNSVVPAPNSSPSVLLCEAFVSRLSGCFLADEGGEDGIIEGHFGSGSRHLCGG